MFVRLIKRGLLIGSTALFMSSTAIANDGPSLDVTLTGLQASEGKLYVSVQAKADYMKQRGEAGGIYEIDTPGIQTYSYKVPAGEYAVSIWHDLDNDGKFSMTKDWIPTDGWGTSGTRDTSKQPTFDDVKLTIGPNGASVKIPMIYRKS